MSDPAMNRLEANALDISQLLSALAQRVLVMEGHLERLTQQVE